MIKKYLVLGALVAPFTFFDKANSFEFPDKPPVGELSANVSYYTNYIWRGEEQTGGYLSKVDSITLLILLRII